MLTIPRWREFYNPLRGLTMARLVAIHDEAERGQHADVQWLYRHMESADVTIQAALARRLAFIDTLDWNVKTIEGADEELARDQAALLRSAYERIENLRDATRDLATSIFRGFAILDTEQSGGVVERLEHIPQWFWIKTAEGEWRLNREALPETQGEEVEQDRLIVLEYPPANKAIATAYYSKVLALADWDSALETSANPNIFFIAPEGSTPEKIAEFQAIADAYSSNGRGALPYGTKVESVDIAARGNASTPYEKRIQYCDQQIVMAATGGILTMLAQSGSGTLAGGAHSQSLLALSQSDAARLSEAYQRAIDTRLLARFFPGQPVAAYFDFDVPQTEDTSKMLEAVANRRFRVCGGILCRLRHDFGVASVARSDMVRA